MWTNDFSDWEIRYNNYCFISCVISLYKLTTSCRKVVENLREKNAKVIMSTFATVLAPVVRPKNVRLDETSMNSTYAVFVWDKVDNDPLTMRGFLRGYKVCLTHSVL